MQHHNTVASIDHARLFIRRCACGFQTSSPTCKGVIELMVDHLRHVRFADRVGPARWTPAAEERAS